MECYNKLIKMGFNHYEVVAATNSVLNKMQDKTESSAKDAHDYLSFYKSEDLVAAIEEGKGYEEILQQMYEEAMTKLKGRMKSMNLVPVRKRRKHLRPFVRNYLLSIKTGFRVLKILMRNNHLAETDINLK